MIITRQQKRLKGMYFVYIVRCKDDTLYTGWTNDIENRLARHNEGKGAKYTRSRFPVKLQYLCEVATKEEALKKEYAIKRLSREKKKELIAEQKRGAYKRTDEWCE